MRPFRAHVHRQGSQWAWEIRQGAGAASRRTGTAASRAEAILAVFSPARRAQLPRPPEHPAALAA